MREERLGRCGRLSSMSDGIDDMMMMVVVVVVVVVKVMECVGVMVVVGGCGGDCRGDGRGGWQLWPQFFVMFVW